MPKSSPNACSGAVEKMEYNHRLSTASLGQSEQFQFFLLAITSNFLLAIPSNPEISTSFGVYSVPLEREEGLESLAVLTQPGRGI
jgi:hypothetical protein